MGLNKGEYCIGTETNSTYRCVSINKSGLVESVENYTHEQLLDKQIANLIPQDGKHVFKYGKGYPVVRTDIGIDTKDTVIVLGRDGDEVICCNWDGELSRMKIEALEDEVNTYSAEDEDIYMENCENVEATKTQINKYNMITEDRNIELINEDGIVTMKIVGRVSNKDLFIPKFVNILETGYSTKFDGYGSDTGIETISGGDGIEIIDGNTFYNQKALNSVSITSTKLREIKYGAFNLCTNLQKFEILQSTPMIRTRFEGCTRLRKIDVRRGTEFESLANISKTIIYHG